MMQKLATDIEIKFSKRWTWEGYQCKKPCGYLPCAMVMGKRMAMVGFEEEDQSLSFFPHLPVESDCAYKEKE